MTNIYWTEMKKLHNMLEEEGIPHKIIKDVFDGYQLVYPDEKNPVCDVICHEYSYGGKKGLLEMSGLCPEDEEGIIGFMTAKQCYRKIYKHFMKNLDDLDYAPWG